MDFAYDVSDETGPLILQVTVRVLEERYRHSLSYSASRGILSETGMPCSTHHVRVNCGGGEQNFKWLADIARCRVSAQEGVEFEHLEPTLVCLGLEDDRAILFPFDIIADKCSVGDKVMVDLAGLPRHIHRMPGSHMDACDGMVTIPTLWQSYATTEESQLVPVLFELRPELFSVSSAPGIIGK